jgi:hypothetical protein
MFATYLSGRIEAMRSRKRISIEGVWGEYIEDSKNHQFTLGAIYWDNKRKIFAFDGTNFENSGAPFCHFKTTSSSIDLDADKLLYTFEAQVPAKPNELYSGFGVVNLQQHGNTLVPVDGYYVSASVDAKPMSHTMVAMNEMTYQKGRGGRELIERMTLTIPPPRTKPQRRPTKKS